MKFILPRRGYRISKYGEVFSQPRNLKFKILHHPVLGKFISEIPDSKPDECDALPKTQHLPIAPGTTLMTALRDHHAHQARPFTSCSDRPRSVVLEGTPATNPYRLSLGQIIMIRRRLCFSKPDHQTFFGVVIECEEKGWQSSVRVRQVVTGVGVEMKVPLYSPLIEDVVILKRPKAVPQGPNLFGVRDRVDMMTRFMPAPVLNEKVRSVVQKHLERGDLEAARAAFA